MKKISMLLLILSLLVVTLACTSCDLNESDNFVDTVIHTVLGEDTPFSKQMANFSIFMQSKVYLQKLTNVINDVVHIFELYNPNNIFLVIFTIFVIVVNGLAWIVSIIVYLFCIVIALIGDLALMFIYALAFLLLTIIYLFNNLLTWIAVLTV